MIIQEPLRVAADIPAARHTHQRTGRNAVPVWVQANATYAEAVEKVLIQQMAAVTVAGTVSARHVMAKADGTINKSNHNQYKVPEMKKEVGHVTAEERDEIQRLFERRNGLNELAKILTPDNSDLYERLVTDMGDTSTKFQQWWDNMYQKYGWENSENGNWEIDFNECSIYLVTPE